MLPRPRDDFVEVDRRLRGIFDPFRARLVATKDDADGLILQIPGLEDVPWGYVGGARVGKRYVSVYLMSVYAQPEVAESMSAELRRRMRGRSCFNFTTIDEPLFEGLARIAHGGLDRYLALASERAKLDPDRVEPIWRV